MSMILDHINGVPDDNRLENLWILCPNCNATLDTHCGRKNRQPMAPRVCEICDREFVPTLRTERHCSRACGTRHRNRRREPRPERRKVPRPPYSVLQDDLACSNYLQVGRKYGVSDNAVRKWVRWYRDSAEAGLKDELVTGRPAV